MYRHHRPLNTKVIQRRVQKILFQTKMDNLPSLAKDVKLFNKIVSHLRQLFKKYKSDLNYKPLIQKYNHAARKLKTEIKELQKLIVSEEELYEGFRYIYLDLLLINMTTWKDSIWLT